MKKAKKLLTFAAAFGAAGVLVSSLSFASYKSNYLVKIQKWDSGGGQASGDLGAVYNNPESGPANIGCTIYTNSSGYKSLYCLAQQEDLEWATCFTNDAMTVMDVAKMLQSDGNLRFVFDANGKCTGIQVGTWSSTRPKAF